MVYLGRYSIAEEELDKRTLYPLCSFCLQLTSWSPFWKIKVLRFAKSSFTNGCRDKFSYYSVCRWYSSCHGACPRHVYFLKEIINSFADLTCLKVNFTKSFMVPINVNEEILDILENNFQCQKGSLPLTYLGLPLGTSKPRVIDW